MGQNAVSGQLSMATISVATTGACESRIAGGHNVSELFDQLEGFENAMACAATPAVLRAIWQPAGSFLISFRQ
jgi:hypothetical protein